MFGVLSTFIIFVNNNLLTVLILFLFVGGYVFLFKKLRVYYTRSDVEQITVYDHQKRKRKFDISIGTDACRCYKKIEFIFWRGWSGF